MEETGSPSLGISKKALSTPTAGEHTILPGLVDYVIHICRRYSIIRFKIWTIFNFKQYFMHIGVLPACMCVTCVSDVCGNQKREQDPLELELQMVVSCHVRAGN